MVKRIILIFSFILASYGINAQEISSKGVFLSDSVKIGEEVQYALTVKYPKDLQVIFTDSSFVYTPFEFYSKTFFPTVSDSTYAYDSAIYSLATFEIEKIQALQIPIYILNGQDSVEVLPDMDSIFLKEMITHVPDSVNFRANIAYLPVDYALNYPYIMIGLAVFLVLLVGAFFLFGKSIRIKIKLYRLRKEFEKFSSNFENGISRIRTNESNTTVVEEILVIWKKYMESIENRPFTKYTSKEIIKAGYGSELKNILQTIDKAIYGNINDEEMHKNFESLEDFTLDRYQSKIKEVQNG